MRDRFATSRFLASAAMAALLAGVLGGCQTSPMRDVTGSITPRESSSIESLGERYRANPRDAQAAIAYGRALRTNGQRAQAAAVLEQAALVNSNNRTLMGEYGRALADIGNFKMAFGVLNQAHTPDNPDWRILSVQGAVLDQMGRHDEARRYYHNALKIVPNEPSVLSNLGLSYVLTKELPQAEKTLRLAMEGNNADRRVRQNLALVVGLQGRFAEAETIAKADLPADEAEANVAYLRQMIASHGGAPRSRS